MSRKIFDRWSLSQPPKDVNLFGVRGCYIEPLRGRRRRWRRGRERWGSDPEPSKGKAPESQGLSSLHEPDVALKVRHSPLRVGDADPPDLVEDGVKDLRDRAEALPHVHEAGPQLSPHRAELFLGEDGELFGGGHSEVAPSLVLKGSARGESCAVREPRRAQDVARLDELGVAERPGLEPPEQLPAQRFSRPPDSATLAPLHPSKPEKSVSCSRTSR